MPDAGGRGGNASPLLDDKLSGTGGTSRDRYEFDHESMQDMELREEDEFATRGMYKKLQLNVLGRKIIRAEMKCNICTF